MHGCVSGWWVSGWVSEWMGGSMNGWVSGCVGAWMGESVDGGSVDGWVSGILTGRRCAIFSGIEILHRPTGWTKEEFS